MNVGLPYFVLNLSQFPCIHSCGTSVDVRRLLSIRETDVPIAGWCLGTIPVVTMSRYFFLVVLDVFAVFFAIGEAVQGTPASLGGR